MAGSISTQPGISTGTLSKFHRSYSMGQGWAVAQQQGSFNPKGTTVNFDENQHPKVVYRRRNNSTSEGDGSLLICYPSENLRRLVPEKILASSIVQTAVSRAPVVESVVDESSKCHNANDHIETKVAPIDNVTNNEQAPASVTKTSSVSGSSSNKTRECYEIKAAAESTLELETSAQLNILLARPAMSFITQKHDLDKLRYAMKRSLRIATCRIYSLQALNWLLRSVTQSVCLHDLMWWFVSSLSVSSMEVVDGKCDDTEVALEHPVSLTQISGRFSHMITQSLHLFLQSVADLTLFLPAGSPLQRIAIQCFGIRFRQADHQFLHSSHVFGNISKILSKSDEQDDLLAISTMVTTIGAENTVGQMTDAEHNFQGGAAGAKLMNYTDLNGMFEVREYLTLYQFAKTKN